jgi:hypothetical protein
MARCGCNAASATTCDAIVLCVAANLGSGLRYDSVNGVLAVRLSGDAGNAASFGSDGGIYVPGDGSSPDPASGRKTIAGLPEQFAGGAATGAGSMLPFGSPESIDYAIANRLDIINISNYALADEVAIARWDTPTANLDVRTDNPSTIDIGLISSLTRPRLLVDAGARDTPTGRNSGAPASLLTPDGGWFGFYAQNYTPMTLVEALNKVAARAVVYLAVFGGAEEADLERYLAASMDAVIQAGAQAWAFQGVNAYMDDSGGNTVEAPFAAWVGDAIAAGLTPVVDMFDDAPGGSTVTPAAVLASGAEWVRMAQSDDPDTGSDFARIQEFINAGLQVIVQVRGSRQFDTALAFANGARGVTSDSPVYSRGARGEPGDLDYRKEIVIPGLLTRTMMEGSLTTRTNDGISPEDIGWARQSAEGRNFSAQFGWEGGIGGHLMSQLLGELCPYEVTSDYRLRVRFRVDTAATPVPAGSEPKLGIFFNAPTDQDITWYEPDPNPSHINGYWVSMRVGSVNQGEVTLGKFNDGNFTVLATSSAFPGVDYGEWIFFNCRTTATQVLVGIGHDTLAGDITISANDTDHRGPYAFYAWEDAYTPPAGNAGFAHGYSAYTNFATTSPMYEDLS